MFQRSRVSAAAILAITAAAVLPAVAQETQRVEITGSSIKRVATEAALPVVVLKKEDIARTGATSTVDLLQRLSTIQGGTVEANSVGGSTYGFSGVSVHNLGETRTLVLLNGRRLSQFGGQTLTGFAAGFDLNAVPVSAIERVEILTDGASALYGADAIAGVVNFITRRNDTDGDISVGISAPRSGARETRFSATKGFGTLEKEGFNFTLTGAYDERTQLKGADRSYAKTGNLVFNLDGKTYRSQNYSFSSIPANALTDAGDVISPHLIATGSCPENTFRVTDGASDFCGFDYVSTLEIYPERKRGSVLGSANFRVGKHDLFADLLLSRTEQISRIAPVPGGISIPAGSAFHTTYLLPNGITGNSTAFYRVADLGLRTNSDRADFLDFAIGSRGTFGEWDYNASLSHSKSTVEGSISGYPGALALSSLRRSGLLNPFLLPGQQSTAGKAGLEGINFKGYFDGGVATLDSLSVNASREVMKLPGGMVMAAVGASLRDEGFQSKPSPFAQGITTNPVTGELCDPNDAAKPCDQRFGDGAAAIPYSADRRAWGLYGELLFPVAKGMEITTALRHDNYSDFGGNTSAKASFKAALSAGLLVRGSVGTGYHAPSVPQINAAPQTYGVTEDPYTCSAALQAIATSLGAVCQPGSRQYDVVAGGNKLLTPEKSRSATLGIVFEPMTGMSASVDYWWVGIKDAFGQLEEATVFRDPARFPTAWTTVTDVGTNTKYVAWNSGNLNLGKEFTSGIDIDLRNTMKFAGGSWVSNLNATYMVRQRYQQETGGKYYSDLGDNTEGGLLYRLKGNWRNTVKHGAWTHALNINYVSGYRDAVTEVEVLNSAGNFTGYEDVSLKIKPFVTLDWQTQWAVTKAFDVTAGVLNVLDKAPPLALSTTGGQQVGYDGNLYDPRGRTVYANLRYKF